MLNWHDAPRIAIEAFEWRTDLRVGVHDLAGSLLPFLPAQNILHTAPICLAVKHAHDAACRSFDGERLREDLADRPDGLVKICHAGLVEWAVPSFSHGRLAWVVFAGPRRAARRWPSLVLDSGPPTDTARRAGSAALAPVDEEEAERILELTRQLVARLELWRSAEDRLFAREAGERLPAPLARRIAVRQFLRERHRQPLTVQDLARHLHMSESRAAHVVRECCGRSFVELLHDERLRSAVELLRQTALPIPEIANRCGFGDASHFHRIFRRRFGLTPHRFRLQC